MLHPLDLALTETRVEAECGEVASAVELAAARYATVLFVLHRELRALRGGRIRRLVACDGHQCGCQQAGDPLHDELSAHAICLLALQREDAVGPWRAAKNRAGRENLARVWLGTPFAFTQRCA